MDVVYKQAQTNEEIKNWVEKNGGKPAIIDDPAVREDEVGLRIDWPGKKDEAMLSEARHETRDISWDEFFEIMKIHNLIFEYSDQKDVDETWSYRFRNMYEVEE